MDYYKLGETTGKAWRLGHMGEKGSAQNDAAIEAATTLLEPTTPEIDEVVFYKGFFEGILAVDGNAQQIVERVDYAALGRSCGQAWKADASHSLHHTIIIGKARAIANDLDLREPAHMLFMEAFIATVES